MNDVDFDKNADDNNIHDFAETIDNIIMSLQEQENRIIQWFLDNQMKRDIDKGDSILSTNEQLQTEIGDSSIKRNICEKLLEVKTDSKLNPDDPIKTICSKVNSKLGVLARATPYMSTEKKKHLQNCFFNAQFNYFQLIWMFCSHSNNMTKMT